jgi:succinate dehydrogenase / fumarate reductase flavoprotein subunit
VSISVPQAILDALTNVEVPRAMPRRTPQGAITADGMRIPLYCSEALVVGSGAAGFRAAVELKRRGVDVVIATQTAFWGTSACSGSDKQTLHTASTARRGDDFLAMAKSIAAGGAMDLDTAYVEAVGSIDALAGLRYLGLPLPEDRFGGVLRYQTDHDEAGRATSCGPRTSRLMVKVLSEEAVRLGIGLVNRCTAIEILTSGSADPRAVQGLLGIRSDGRSVDNPYGLAIFAAPAVVIATGGPGELFRDSVYPRHCFGSLGMALEAGIELTNLTECQFGIGTRRDEFPWNLSGTYVQAMPYVYSIDSERREHNFLADYYRTTQELASNLFRKGYQWPFHATRMLDFGSSLVDLAIARETRAGRTVVMDFNRNPQPAPGGLQFSLARLDRDVRAYLGNNEALLARPIERLQRMNPLSIELYRQNKHDLTRDPLPFNVNHQHMNGGIAVNVWGQSSLAGCYAIGEAAGTHGATRPGGAALNSGQVFGIRCAKHIRAHRDARVAIANTHGFTEVLTARIAEINRVLHHRGGLSYLDFRDSIQARMSDNAGFLCDAAAVRPALEAARVLNESIRTHGLAIDDPAQIANGFLWRQTALTSEAVLTALDYYIANGGGSRGARAICSPTGSKVPQTRLGPLEGFRFVAERDEDRREQLRVRYENGVFSVRIVPVRDLDGVDGIYFEKNWAPYLTGAIYD